MERTAYEDWAEGEGIPIIRGYGADLGDVPVAPWKRTEGLGAIVLLDGSEQSTATHVSEIPPGQSLKPQRHIFEELILILRGEGWTEIWRDGGPKRRVQWKAGSLLTIPLNTWHQHGNAGREPARYFGFTNATTLINLFRDEAFVFDSDQAFADRFNGEADYFTRGQWLPSERAHIWQASFIDDVVQIGIPEQRETMGKGYTRIHCEMPQNLLWTHIADMEVGTYKKAHRHGSGAHIVVLKGEGYALLWPSEGGERVRVNWRPGTVYAPPTGWFHCHYNTTPETARHIAFHGASYRVGGKQWKVDVSLRQGGDMLDYEDEDPAIRKLYEEELARRGVPVRMPPLKRTP